MSWQTNKLVLSVRNFGRMIGFNNLVASYLTRGGYEEKYDTQFKAKLVKGDCVWDVGANVGYYTRMFSSCVGDTGIVYAFEPSPTNFLRLSDECAALKNARLLQFGLGCENGRLFFQQGVDALGATSRVVDSSVNGATVIEIRAAASLISNDGVLTPNAVKIDVEGFEYEVLQGFGEQLSAPSLRAVGIEVHFSILKSRGMTHTPNQIVSLLEQHGFTVSWPDMSHILASRQI
jgi:FkbM family methyltransferase